jgi:fructose-specific phosphotransferase system IIA component
VGVAIEARMLINMTLGDILQKETIITNLKSTDRWEVIDELVDHLVQCGKLKLENRDQVVAAVKKREAAMSTGIGFGIGIPHASTDMVYEVAGAFGRSTQGIQFEAVDNEPVNLVLLILVPQGQFQKHLQTLAGIAKLLHNKEFRDTLVRTEDPEAMLNLIRNPHHLA